MTQRPSRKLVFATAAALMGLATALLVGEVVLRVAGRTPWRHLTVDENEPTVHEPHPRLGWRAKPGRHSMPPYSEGAEPIEINFLPDGSRATGNATTPRGSREVLFVGGSFTQGWAIADHETFAWRLQERFPSLRVRNLATGAYGGYQSLLMLEAALAETDPPEIAIYGFIRHHAQRNVAEPSWLRMLASFARRGLVGTPYATLDADGHLVRHAPISYPRWPLREWLASAALLEERYAQLAGRARSAQANAVTQRLFIEMDQAARARGTDFYVLLLDDPKAGEDTIPGFLRSQGIGVIDCRYPLTKKFEVEGEGHPNGAMNARWANCIARTLAPLL